MKKILKSILILLLAIILLFTIYAFASGRTYLFKAIIYNFADIDDYTIFDNNIVARGTAQPWPVSGFYNKITVPGELDQLLSSLKTVGLVVIKSDSLLYERYWGGGYT